MEIAGKKVLLTGATGGLGRAMASTLAGAGAEMILSGRNKEALQGLADELAGSGHSVLAADLGVEGGALDLAGRAGNIDCLVPELVAQKLHEKIDVAHKFEAAEEPKRRSRKKRS